MDIDATGTYNASKAALTGMYSILDYVRSAFLTFDPSLRYVQLPLKPSELKLHL